MELEMKFDSRLRQLQSLQQMLVEKLTASEQRSATLQFGMILLRYIHCLKKVPIFKLSVTLSNLNRFLKCLHCWKAYGICYKTYMTLPTSP